jgi:radical SAM protein with 4Fe4S-binding SPASM domain
MRKKQVENKASNWAPALFSFITLREETFGAILFNPFLPAEVELNDLEALVAGMCSGAHTLDEIQAECQAAFNLAPEDAGHKLDETIKKIETAYALRFIEKRVSCPFPEPRPVHINSTAPFSAPKTVIWDITYACNLNCPHCLTDSGHKQARELDTEEAFRLIEILAASKVLYLSLTGGEPFLRPDILEILARIAETGMRVDIASNGFHVSQKIIRALRDLPVFQIQVSIDGIGVEHDLFRGKRGTFENACRTLRRFKEEGLSTSISTTATAQNIDKLDEIIDLAIELGCDAFKAIPFIPAGRGKHNEKRLKLDRSGSSKLSKTLIEKSKELAGKINISTESTFLFLLDRPTISNSADGAMICSAGYDELSIGANGVVYPCPFLHDFPLGNLFDDSLASIWHESAALNELRGLKKMAMAGPCQTCEYAPEHCRGGCRAAAYFNCGNLRGSDPLCFKDLLT